MVEAIRNQIVYELREGLDNCPDGVVYCVEPELEEVNVDWGPDIPDGLRIKTDRGTFAVHVSVTRVDG